MDSKPDVIFRTDATGFFGVNISGAGDVNDDGFDDVVLGSRNYASIYYGAAPMDPDADVILNGESDGDMFGFCVSHAGDVNQDGFDDVIIGAYGYFSDGDDAGRAYIYYGSSTMDDTADVIFTGEEAGDYFGEQVAAAGDVNNDGFADIMVSAPRNDSDAEDAGRVYIFYGANPMDTHADIIIGGKYPDVSFGRMICPAGDINNDNFDDLLIGTYENLALFFGGDTMNDEASIVLLSESTGGYISGVAGKGDYNNDGYADVITGQPNSDKNGDDAGCVALFYGSQQMDVSADVLFYGEPADEYFGSRVSAAGDLNHDGYADIIIGAPEAEIGGSSVGCAYIYFGGVDLDANPDVIIPGNIAHGNWGRSISAAGDVNKDGFSDVIVGGFNAGEVAIYLGNNAMDSLADFTFSTGKWGDGFGGCVAGAGDLNQDGFDDVIIGASCDYSNGTHTGCAYIYFGGNSIANTPDLILVGEAEFNNFGERVASAGDVNNDGYPDVIVGAPGYELGGEDVGRVYIFYGGHDMNAEPDVIITGKDHQHCGSIIAPAGDINNDGYADIIIASPY